MNKKFNLDASLNIEKDLVVQGDLQVKGSTKTFDTETLTVKDNLIMVNGLGEVVTGVITDNGSTGALIHAGTKLHFPSAYQFVLKIHNKYKMGDNYGRKEKAFLKNVKTYLEHPDYMSAHNPYGGISYFTDCMYNDINIGGDFRYSFEFYINDCIILMTDGASSKNSYPTEDMISANFKQIDLTIEEDVFIDNDFFEILNETAIIQKGIIEKVRVSMASPVLVGDTLKIGEGIAIKDENGNITNFEFNEGAAQAVATRADSIEDEAILSWDATNYTIVDSGKKVSNILTQDNFVYDETTKTLNIIFEK